MNEAQSGWNKINHAMRTLSDKWDQTEAGWRDQKRVEFEKTCIDPLRAEVEASLRAIKALSEILGRARRECRDDFENE
jgi:hypothetical protein